jgi:Regulator of chromosome condensation (RCC1) repeat
MKTRMHSPSWQATLRGAFFALAFIVINGAATTPLLGQNPLRVHTHPANAIRATSATLNGMILPGINPAAVWFESGTSSQYGSTSGRTNVAAGDRVIELRHALNGLSPDYMYHFRLAASNIAGVVYGADQQFTLGTTVMVWGNTSYGLTPVPADLTNAVAIGTGGKHCLALRNDGTVVAWGDNVFGQTNVPAGLSNVAAIAAGQYHNLVLTFTPSESQQFYRVRVQR